MFTKLLKYEFRTVKKALLPLTVAALLSAVLGYVMMLIISEKFLAQDDAIFVFLSMILLFGILVLFVVYSVGSAFYLFYRFYKGKFTDEGYLTFTLPATTHQILLANIVNIVIWNLITLLVAIVCYFLTFAPLIADIGESPFQPIFEISYDGNIFVSIIQTLGSFSYGIILPMLSITIGSLIAKKHKILAAFGVGYLISMFVSIITAFLSIVELAAVESIYSGITVDTTRIVTGVLMLAISVGGYFIMHYLVKNKLNI